MYLSVNIDPELTFALHVKTVVARCFHHLCQLWTIQRALSDDNARMLVHALISNYVAIAFSTASLRYIYARSSLC